MRASVFVCVYVCACVCVCSMHVQCILIQCTVTVVEWCSITACCVSSQNHDIALTYKLNCYMCNTCIIHSCLCVCVNAMQSDVNYFDYIVQVAALAPLALLLVLEAQLFWVVE